jgi:two-component system, chemotaxis family, sensor kinase CheA
MEDFELELKLEFLTESQDLLQGAEEAFLRLEKERDNNDLLNEIFRLAHNLKGTSKAVGFDQLADLTHVAENLILKLKEGSIDVSDSVVSTLLIFKDKIHEMVEGLSQDINASFETDELKIKIEIEISGSAVGVELGVESSESEWEDIAEIETKELIEEHDVEISDAAIESLRESGIDEELIQQMLGEKKKEPDVPEEHEKTIQPQQKKNNSTPLEIEESIRVKSSRIEKLNDVIGELVIIQTVLSQRRYEFINDDLTNKSIGMMSKLFKELQELAMSLRMLPLKTTFQKMTRIVRDTSKLLEKEVELHLLGEETEVDKTVLEKISDPLVHIVRNAVDHGLEVPTERVGKGKEAKGHVELMAFHEGSNLVIQVTDDGKGIDPAVIRKKAIEKKIISENKSMTDQEIIQLIFHPGFSTKEQVTEVSGRGVGMDVVKTNIEGLGGEVKLMSRLGEGSSLRIILPLTLAIIEGLVIKLGGDRFVLPLAQINEITQIKQIDIETFSGVGKLFKLRGEVLPLFHLEQKLSAEPSQAKKSLTVIIIRSAQMAFGVVVDDIINQQQIVIKKLGDDIKHKKGVIGSAILSDGMPSLILDLNELYKDDLKKNKNITERQIGLSQAG